MHHFFKSVISGSALWIPAGRQMALALALGTFAAPGGAADYPQTLAAQGSDAAAALAPTAIDRSEIDAAFSTDDLQNDPAVSDLDVMQDLQHRIHAGDQLVDAKNQLAPVETVQTEVAATDKDGTAADDTAAIESPLKPRVAAR